MPGSPVSCGPQRVAAEPAAGSLSPVYATLSAVADIEPIRDRAGHLTWWFPHHRDEAAEIVVAILARIFQNKKDHLADQMMAVVKNALTDYWRRVDADRAIWLSRQLAAVWADGWMTARDWDGTGHLPQNPYDPPEPT